MYQPAWTADVPKPRVVSKRNHVGNHPEDGPVVPQQVVAQRDVPAVVQDDGCDMDGRMSGEGFNGLKKWFGDNIQVAMRRRSNERRGGGGSSGDGTYSCPAPDCK